jgi:glycosyltransferase involved in cell wall biosynthesis
VPAEPSPLGGIRVGIALGSLRLGGAERQALHLARHLRSIGADARVLGMGEPGRVTALCDQAGIPWRSLPGFREAWRQRRRGARGLVDRARAALGGCENAVALLRYARQLRRERCDILVAYTIRANVACALTWRLAGARACIWGQRDDGRPYFASWVERYALRRASVVVANASVGVDWALQQGMPAQRVQLVHNGVSLDPPAAFWRQRLGLSPNRLVAGMVANLHASKDHVTLLRAWQIVCRGMPADAQPPVLCLAGTYRGTEIGLKALAFDLGLGDTVRFLGPVEDIAGLLSAVDLGILSSQREGLPNAVLEYMAAGLPVVATDIPGVREALGEGAAAYLAPPGDADALAERVLTLLCSDDLRKAAGAANRERVAREFALQRMCVEMAGVIQSLAADARKGDRVANR